MEDVLNEINELAKSGYKEVVLTGIHLSSYGVDFPEEKKETLQFRAAYCDRRLCKTVIGAYKNMSTFPSVFTEWL